MNSNFVPVRVTLLPFRPHLFAFRCGCGQGVWPITRTQLIQGRYEPLKFVAWLGSSQAAASCIVATGVAFWSQRPHAENRDLRICTIIRPSAGRSSLTAYCGPKRPNPRIVNLEATPPQAVIGFPSAGRARLFGCADHHLIDPRTTEVETNAILRERCRSSDAEGEIQSRGAAGNS
jgi:hypothetical protein